jgi:putative ABC transport system substrate-binding protein
MKRVKPLPTASEPHVAGAQLSASSALVLPLALALLVSSLAAPLHADAGQRDKIYRIGMLERTPTATNAANVDAFRLGLRELGYAEEKNFVIEYRSADGHDDRFPALANELVQLKVDLILTRGTPAALAAKNATGTIPVVITGVGDPVGQGVVASLARPGTNITGLSAAVTDIYPKRVQLLRELVPKVTRVAALFNMSNPALPPQWREVEMAARSLGIEPQLLDVRKREDLEPAFDAAMRQRATALIVGIETLTQTHQQLIVDLAARRRLPAMYASTEFAGGLISYGVNYPEMYRRAARFADKIFKGAKPANIPVEEPTTFELVINLNTARALGPAVPPALLLSATTVIDRPISPQAP